MISNSKTWQTNLRQFIFIAVFLLVVLVPQTSVGAPDPSVKLDLVLGKLEQLTQVVEDQQKRIERLEEENSQLRSHVSRNSVSPESTSASRSNQAAANSRGLSGFNPEIGVVADITGIATESDEDLEGNDKLSVRELEVVFGHDIDPYSRFDSTITFSDFEDPTIEEAYITHWGMPIDIRAKLGRMRPKIGKANVVHRDQLDTVDVPFVNQEYLGIEGLFRTGLELNYFMPFSSNSVTQEFTLGVMEGGIGEEGTLFGGTRRRPTLYSHLENFWEISDASSMEFGFTYMLGSADEDSGYEVSAFGLNTIYLHHLNATDRIKLQTEFYFQDRDQAALEGEGHVEHGSEELDPIDDPEEVLFDGNPFGFYVLGDYRFSGRFGLGGRFDYVEPVNLEEGLDNETLGYSGYFTYYQSEYLRFRLQYSHVDLPLGDDNRFFLQATTAIGVHKHQLQ